VDDTLLSQRSDANWVIKLPPPPADFFLRDAPADFRAIHKKWIVEGEPITKEEFVYYHAERGRRDLFFLGKHILGFDRLQEDLHAPLAWACQAPNGTALACSDGERIAGRERLFEQPRGTLKTTIITVCYTIFRILQNQDERILIYSSNLTMAQKPFSQIRQRLEGKGPNGKLFLACYGNILPARAEREKWSDSALTVKRPTPYSDATLEASGIGATINGSHFSVEMVDDIVGKQETREQMQKICDIYDGLTPLYDALETGERRFVCTPWAFFDPSVHVERNRPAALLSRRCLFETPAGEPITDARDFSYETLIYRWRETMNETIKEARQLKRTNSYFYSCQYECNPRDEKRIGFFAKWFRTFVRRADMLIEHDENGKEGKSIPLARCNVFVLIDPNTGRVPGTRVDPNKPVQASTDYVGIVVVAVSPENKWYVVEAYRERYNPQEFVNKVFALVAYWSPRSVAIEQRSAQRWIRTVFQGEWRRGRPIFNLRDWDGAPVAKEERIRGLIPKVAEGFLLFRTQAPDYVQDGIDALKGELLDFPNAQYDDSSDALSAGLQICVPPGKDAPRGRVEALEDFDRDMLRLDASSARVWRSLRSKEHTTGLGNLGEFWH